MDTTEHTPRFCIHTYLFDLLLFLLSPLCLCKCSGNTVEDAAQWVRRADSEVAENVHMYVYVVCMLYSTLYSLATYLHTVFGRAYRLPSSLMVVAFLLLDATQVCHSRAHTHTHTHL